jgi:predicted esterase
MAPEVETLLRSTVQRIRASGGRVVGLIGFSQGTKIVAGLLRASEYLVESGSQEEDWCRFDLALSVCASYPPPLFPSFVPEDKREGERKIEIPTFHVQGTQDEWNWAGKELIEKYYDVSEGDSEFVEWDMGHHYPVAVEESERIAKWMVAVYKKVEEKRQEK